MTAILDLRREVAKSIPLRLPGLGDISASDLAAAREHWRIHMVAEFASARVFSGLVPQLMAAELDFDYVRAATEMALQEIDHGLLSARVFAALGGDPRSELPSLDPVPMHADVPAVEAALRNVISISCSGETLAVAVIGGERERATSHELRAVLTQILSDEVGHARFGWRLLAEVAPSLGEDALRRTSAYLVAVFERDLRGMRGCLGMSPVSDAALGLGAPDGPAQWACFWATMTSVTIPGLERFGLKAEWAWARAQERVIARD